MSKESRATKCACQACGGHIEFSSEAVGENIVCPHCGAGTILCIPLVLHPAPGISIESPLHEQCRSAWPRVAPGSLVAGSIPPSNSLSRLRPVVLITACVALVVFLGAVFAFWWQRNAVAEASEAAMPIEIKGQIYLALVGGGSVKLAAVDVFIVDADEFKARIAAQEFIVRSNLTYWTQEKNRLSRYDSLTDDALRARARVRYWRSSAALVPEGWSKIIYQTTSDADGRFILRVPSKGRFYVAARARRFDGGYTRNYGWLVPAPSDPSDEFFLNNNNVLPDLDTSE